MLHPRRRAETVYQSSIVLVVLVTSVSSRKQERDGKGLRDREERDTRDCNAMLKLCRFCDASRRIHGGHQQRSEYVSNARAYIQATLTSRTVDPPSVAGAVMSRICVPGERDQVGLGRTHHNTVSLSLRCCVRPRYLCTPEYPPHLTKEVRARMLRFRIAASL